MARDAMPWRRQATHQVGTPSRWLRWSGLERCGSSWDWTPKPTPRRHQEISLAANRYEPEVVLQRVEALSQCFVEMSVQRPTHNVTEEHMVHGMAQAASSSSPTTCYTDGQPNNHKCNPYLKGIGPLSRR